MAISNLISQAIQSGQNSFRTGDSARQMVDATASDRAALQSGRRKALTSMGTTENRMRRRVGAGLSSAVAQSDQGPPSSFSASLDDALRRSKVRQRIAQQGDAAIASQGLRDRIAIASASRARQGALQDTAANAYAIRHGVDVSAQEARDSVSASRAGMFGGIAGGIGGVLANQEGRQGISSFFGNLFNRGGDSGSDGGYIPFSGLPGE